MQNLGKISESCFKNLRLKSCLEFPLWGSQFAKNFQFEAKKMLMISELRLKKKLLKISDLRLKSCYEFPI